MNKNNMMEKYEHLVDKLEGKEEFLSWNKNFTRKFNKVILVLLIINTLMATPICLYGMGIIPTLTSVTGAFYAGFYGLIGGGCAVTAGILGNVTLIANRLYLNKNIKDLTRKINITAPSKQYSNLNQNSSKVSKEEVNNKQENLTTKKHETTALPYGYNYTPNFVIVDSQVEKSNSKTRVRSKIK